MAHRAPHKTKTHSIRSSFPLNPLFESNYNTPSKLFLPTLDIGLLDSSSQTESVEVTQPIQQEISYFGIT
jgi:hypothetical protein